MIDSTTKKIVSELLNVKGSITVEALSFSLGVSPSAIKMRLPIIREIASFHNGKLEEIPNLGLTLKIDDLNTNKFIHYINENFDYSTSSNMRFIYIVDTLLSYGTSYTIELLCEELAIQGLENLTKIAEELEER